MISIAEYFERYLGYGMGMISSDSLNPQFDHYETYRDLDDRLLEWHADHDNDPGAMEELGERCYFMKKEIDSAVSYLEKASNLGNGDASAVLSQICRIDLKDWDNYQKYVQLSAEQGCATGLFNLSCCYYKGKEAYEGHGFNQDKQKALELSLAASQRARELIHFILTHRCSNGFREYFDQQVGIFIQSTCTAAEQMISGDGVQKNPKEAEELLLEANRFAEEHFRQKIQDFTALLQQISGNI